MAAELNHRQMQFIREYLIDGSVKQAAIRAGYSPATAEQQGSRLLRNVRVAAELEKRRSKVVAKVEAKFDLTLDRLLAEYQRIAMTGMSRFLTITPDGDPMVDLSKCSPEDLDLLAEVTVEDFTDGRGKDRRNVKRIKIKPLDRLNAMKELGRHLGLGAKAEAETMATFAKVMMDLSKNGSAAPIAED